MVQHSIKLALESPVCRLLCLMCSHFKGIDPVYQHAEA